MVYLLRFVIEKAKKNLFIGFDGKGGKLVQLFLNSVTVTLSLSLKARVTERTTRTHNKQKKKKRQVTS
jgi:hypothetical protein